MPQVEVRVAVILVKGNKILLAGHRKRSRTYWVLPGGKVEYGETIEETAKREMKEETNLKIRLNELVFIDETITGNGGRHVINFYFTAKALSGKLKVAKGKVLREAKFFSPKQVKDLIVLPDIKKDLQLAWANDFKGVAKYLGNRWSPIKYSAERRG
ncbi:NUDIX hydrolase [bacterium]|nr:NUDIX hydrolase [bacterium]